MFAKKMKLQCRLRQIGDGLFMATGTAYDGTAFDVQVDKNDIIINEPFREGISEGWLLVTQEARQENRVYLTLSKPSIPFGHQIVVNAIQLLPVNVTLNDFNPKTS
jgi:hypothetical protein